MTSEQTKTRGPQIQVRTGLQGETDGNKTNSLRHPCAKPRSAYPLRVLEPQRWSKSNLRQRRPLVQKQENDVVGGKRVDENVFKPRRNQNQECASGGRFESVGKDEDGRRFICTRHEAADEEKRRRDSQRGECPPQRARSWRKTCCFTRKSSRKARDNVEPTDTWVGECMQIRKNTRGSTVNRSNSGT